ncbi:MAG: hypothetical protein M1816_006076 [Peltula sp. TS41687]|nr:MAG: hypothetical protein M1816_006076 [Peltula sp. TS41687]
MAEGSFDWVFLVELLVCGLLTIIFLFYFNRLFAALVSYGLRTYTWTKYRVYVDVQAIQVSLLAGRLFFKGLRYHGENETVLIQSGHITWRYWYRNVKTIDLARASGATGNESSNHTGTLEEQGGIESSVRSLPCRLEISVQGLEWYLYNRSAAYDALVLSILSQDGTHPRSKDGPDGVEQGAACMEADSKCVSPREAKQQTRRSSLSSLNKFSGRFYRRLSNFLNKILQDNQEGQHLPSPVLAAKNELSSFPLLKFLPVSIVCQKGAVVMGNENVRCILTVKFDKAAGEFDATNCSPPDPFRQLINFHFTHPVMQMKPNLAHKESPSGKAAGGNKTNVNRASTSPAYASQRQQKLRKHHHFWKKSEPSYSDSLNPNNQLHFEGSRPLRMRSNAQRRWVGLSRYLEDRPNDGPDQWRSIEYGMCCTIIDSPGLSVSYYWDVASAVTHMDDPSGEAKPKTAYINRGLPPKWGLDLAFEGGTINYGPWSDRHRLELQSIFFPRLFKDAVPATVLELGTTRVSTAFKVFIELRGQMTLRIPTRESSKDSNYKVPAVEPIVLEILAKPTWRKKLIMEEKRRKRFPEEPMRPHGWIDIKISPDSTISYVMDMAASTNGFHSTLDLDFRRTEISTSVNHGILWRCESLKTACELPTPLKWNALHTWVFNIVSNSTEIFLLREHIILFSDLVTDWSTGPPPEYFTFAPFKYIINLNLQDLQMFLNVNDANIINNPCDLDDNSFMIIRAPNLQSNVVIPLMKYRPDSNEIPFQVDINPCQITPRTAPWKTQSSFFVSNDVGSLKTLSICGRYGYHTGLSPSSTDTLILDIQGSGGSLDLFGFLIRYCLKIKDNYFGDDIHFKTLDEYQALGAKKEISVEKHDDARTPQNPKNGLDVILSIEVVDAHINLPANLDVAKGAVQISVACLNVDLRFTNYYMDLAVKFSPLSASLAPDNGASTEFSGAMPVSRLFVDGLDVHGHRLFGLPPTEPTYMCNWDFQVGKVTGDCSVNLLKKLVSGCRGFIFSFDDDENSLPPIRLDTIPDVTFLRLRIQSLQLLLHMDHAAFVLSASGMTLNLNDWASTSISKRIDLELPDLKVDCIASASACHHKEVDSPPKSPDGHLETTLTLSIVERKSGSTISYQHQQHHIELHDEWTSRTHFLLRSPNQNGSDARAAFPDQQDPVTMAIPAMPPPVTDAHDWSSKPTARRGRSQVNSSSTSKSSRRSSFLAYPLPRKDNTSTARTSRSSSSKNGPAAISSPRWIHASGNLPLGASGNSVARNDDIASKQKDASPNLPNPIFSSSFLPPSVPLRFVQPTTESIPHLPSQEDELDFDARLSSSLITAKSTDEECSHTAVIIRFGPGLIAFANPQSIASAAQLFRQLQTTDAADILDDLQMEVISAEAEFAKQTQTPRKLLDLDLELPYVHLRFKDTLSDEPSLLNRNTEAEYDVLLRSFSTTLRYISPPSQPDTVTSVTKLTALHARLESAGISVGIPHGVAVIQASIEHIVFQLHEDKTISVALQFKRIELATQSKQMKFGTCVIQRISGFAQEVSEEFSKIAKDKIMRLQGLVFFLISKGKKVPDPASLTRPSHVLLRTAAKHLRRSDSWKIISRLRQIHHHLSVLFQAELGPHLSSMAIDCPTDARSQVVKALGKWRNEELANVKKSYIMQKIYGSRHEFASANTSGLPSKVSVNARAMKLIADPGPNQSEVGVDLLAVCVSNRLPVADADGPPMTSSTNLSHPATIVEIYSEKTVVRLNWDLCKLAEHFLPVQREERANHQPTTEHSKPSNAIKQDNQYQIIYVTSVATITFDTPNIMCMTACKGLQGSILANADLTRQSHPASMALRAAATTSEILSHGRLLATSKVVQSNLCVSHQSRVNDGSDGKSAANTKIASTCKELSCAVEEEFSTLMQTIDLIVGDEFVQLHDRLGRLSINAQSDQPRVSKSRGTSNKQFSVALLLDTYRLSVVLIPSLSYVTSGRVARASISPRPKSTYVFDFDLKEQKHQTVVEKGEDTNSLSTLRVPSVNGHIVGKQSKTRNRCQVLISVDAVRIEAAAINNFLATLNRPELISFTKQVIRHGKLIKAHIDKVLGSDAQGSSITSVPAKPLAYDCRFAVSGIRVHATAPSRNVDSETCEAELNLGSVHIRALSNADPQGAILNFPDIQLGLPHISAELVCSQELVRQPCGTLTLGAHVECSSVSDPIRGLVGSYHAEVDKLQVDLSPETASTAVHIVSHLQDMVKRLDFSREAHYLRKLRKPKSLLTGLGPSKGIEPTPVKAAPVAFTAVYSLEILSIQIKWIASASNHGSNSGEIHDLVLSSDRIDLIAKEGKTARLRIEVLQLQMMPVNQVEGRPSQHSALLPEVTFNVAYLSDPHNRKLAFQAAGKLLELRFTPRFILPAAHLQRSMDAACAKFNEALASWDRPLSDSGGEEKVIRTSRNLMSVLVDADFAGAVVYMQGTETLHPESVAYQASGSSKMPPRGRHEQPPHGDSNGITTLRAPGMAVKLEYKGDSPTSPSLSGEIKISSATNILYPSFVPLILELTSSIKHAISKSEENQASTRCGSRQEKDQEDESILQPEGILGRCRLNVGLRICKQEFTLSCEPIAKVTASTSFEDVYVTLNTARSSDHGQFLTVSAGFSQMQAAVQHVYSRDPTGSFEVDSISLSIMNSKHLSGTSGISAILKVGHTKSSINVRQLQDFLLFRELWIRTDRHTNANSADLAPAKEPQAYLVQRSHQVVAASAVPWDLAVVITELDLQMELGQALGRSCLTISNLWSSSRKSSDWEQNLCLGFDKLAVHGCGRLSELVEVHKCKLRTSIQWPARKQALVERPLVQAAVSFDRLLVRVAFDHQVFLAAKVDRFSFFMYNARERTSAKSDRLVATLDGDGVYVACTATSVAQGAALYQAIIRLVQEKQAAVKTSLEEIQRSIRRKSNGGKEEAAQQPVSVVSATKDDTWLGVPGSLSTDVAVSIKSFSVAVFPNTLVDNQTFKVEVQNARARFAVGRDQGRIHSRLGLTLGQLRIAVSVLRRMRVPTKIEEADVDEIVTRAAGSRDGTILKVPRVVATMQTWQDADSNHIDYTFRSSFEGKVDVGWNYSRIGFIRALWSSHSRALSQRLGKPVSPSKVKITGAPRPEPAGADTDVSSPEGKPEKITAVVDVPQSRYEYRALETPVIETPQLRDMGEATPPLEWIGFQRDKLPNLTHQLIIVALLKVAREVEEAYSRILGTS